MKRKTKQQLNVHQELLQFGLTFFMRHAGALTFQSTDQSNVSTYRDRLTNWFNVKLSPRRDDLLTPLLPLEAVGVNVVTLGDKNVHLNPYLHLKLLECKYICHDTLKEAEK